MQLLLIFVSLFKMARSVSVDEVRAMANKPYQPTHISFPACKILYHYPYIAASVLDKRNDSSQFTIISKLQQQL